jgi:hypothetical protein
VLAAFGTGAAATGLTRGPGAGTETLQAHAAAARPKAPGLKAPASGARVQSVPAFSWSAVRGAAQYEFQLSADEDFGSIVLGQGKGSFLTSNTYATIDQPLASGTYFWRVRGVTSADGAGTWSGVRRLNIAWSDRPDILGPAGGADVAYPSDPLVLRWSRVPRAYKYLVEVATDPALASPVLGGLRNPVETSGTVFAFPGTLAPGRYYWAITPLDSAKHRGARSEVASFDWSWPTATATALSDLNADARVFDPQLSWDGVPGAATYEVEINSSQDFAPGSKVCCSEVSIGTSLSPQKVLPNNHYYWRVRALDLQGNAGLWNLGPEFDKSFDAVTPTVPNLRLRDNVSDLLAAGSTTSTPVIAWDPVPGAASYEVQVVPYTLGGCNWTSATIDTWTGVRTASTAWTPLGTGSNGRVPGGVSFPRPTGDTQQLVSGHSYCARVLAHSDRDLRGGRVVSDWTQLGGLGNVAFTYQQPVASSPPTGPIATAAGNYLAPVTGTTIGRMPLFTWLPVAGARAYFVVVAKDASFTDVIDVAFVKEPAYAPRAGVAPRTYPDETTSYYWVVMPATEANGSGVTTVPAQNSPRAFQKRSEPPALLSPGVNADVTTQPVFRWSAVEAAREYRLQVSQDPTFANLSDDVRTDATSYTSAATYPADTALYWRVRASDENGIGLTWSQTGIFRRRLATPVLDGQNPAGGDTIPALSWSPVQGATSYDIHVDQANGTTRDFRLRSSAFTPTAFYGTGIWHWQVRARFPAGGATETAGPYSRALAYARRIDAPAGVQHVKAGHSLLLSWDPSPMVKSYRVQIARNSGFTKRVEIHDTANTTYAPRLNGAANSDGGILYWRVTAIDEGGNQGAWTTRSLSVQKRLQVSVRGFLQKGRKGTITVLTRDGSGHAVKNAAVRVSGGGVRARRRTGRSGTARFKLRPRSRGRLIVSVTRRGYQSGRGSVRVR